MHAAPSSIEPIAKKIIPIAKKKVRKKRGCKTGLPIDLSSDKPCGDNYFGVAPDGTLCCYKSKQKRADVLKRFNDVSKDNRKIARRLINITLPPTKRSPTIFTTPTPSPEFSPIMERSPTSSPKFSPVKRKTSPQGVGG